MKRYWGIAMAQLFIVRPFGLKQGIDFDDVEKRLIVPALALASITGSTTKEIVEAGNIREDMFRLLVTADVVLADVSIHNANVFYELGIRHGLRPRATVMIRSAVKDHDYPFDLQTDRYLVYDAANPDATVAELARVLKETLGNQRTDSPVYQLLPQLKAPDPAVLRVVPQDFGEEVQIAFRQSRRGDLRLLAYEARNRPWGSEGLRAVGRAQFALKAYGGAKETFELLLAVDRNDVEANQRLATIYQRLDDLPASDIAIQRVIDSPDRTRNQLAEVLSLRARNKKEQWRHALDNAAANDPVALQTLALQTAELEQAQKAYAAAFSHDLNAYYPGANALSLQTIRLELARALPDVWNAMFDSDEAAKAQLDAEQAEFQVLSGSVQLCVRSTLEYLKAQRTPNTDDLMWASVTDADVAFLIAKRPQAVAQRYRKALTDASDFAICSVLEQLELFERLAVRREFAAEALKVVRELDKKQAATAPKDSTVILFTGHRIDEPGRKVARFPNTPAAEAEARRLIREAVVQEQQAGGTIIGIAGAASGADILFLEICAELGIATRLYLALPADQFSAASVVSAGPQWVARYNRLTSNAQPRILSERKELPNWLATDRDYGLWERNNLWMMFNALAENAARLTLIALWNGLDGDGPGGTKDLVMQVESRGHKCVRVDASGLAKL
jgi:hypothetical protein